MTANPVSAAPYASVDTYLDRMLAQLAALRLPQPARDQHLLVFASKAQVWLCVDEEIFRADIDGNPDERVDDLYGITIVPAWTEDFAHLFSVAWPTEAGAR